MPEYAQWIAEPDDVEARLSQMALSTAILHDTVKAGLLSTTRLTPDHPETAPGFFMWAEASTALHQLGRPLGWQKGGPTNCNWSVHEALGLIVIVAGGDANTGCLMESASTRSKKGKHARNAITANHYPQPDLFPEAIKAEALAHLKPNLKGKQVWFLLHHVDKTLGEIRLELSRARSIADNGYVSDWEERICLPAIPLDGAVVDIQPVDGPDIDIDVRRKA